MVAASPGDGVALSRLEQRVTPYPWTLSQCISSCRDSSQRVWLLREADELCGFAVFQCVLDEASLLNVAIEPELQGAGCGRLLLQQCLGSLRDQRCERVLLEVRCSNVRAQSLYHRLGFVEDGVRKRYYPTAEGREDALLMSLNLLESHEYS